MPAQAHALPKDHLRQRRTILRAAEAQFAVLGYRGTSVREIAARSRCSVGHLYNLYGNKLGLYLAVMQERLEKLRAAVEPALNEPGPVVGRLRLLFRSVLSFFEENSRFFRIYAIESGSQIWQTRDHRIDPVKEHYTETMEQVVRLIEEGQRRGEFRRELSARGVAVSLYGVIRGHTTDWIWSGEEGSLVDGAEGMLDLILGGLLKRRGKL